MNESIIQHQLVIWFSQSYPEYKGLLFSVNNDTFNVKDAQKRKALGLIKGVSDLCLVVPDSGKLAGIELKKPRSYHSVSHIQNQLYWGDKIISSGGYYLMTSDLDVAKVFIKSLLSGDVKYAQNIQIKQRMLLAEQFVNKTVLF